MKNKFVLVSNVIIIVLALVTKDLVELVPLVFTQIFLDCYFYVKDNPRILSIGLIFFMLLEMFHCSCFMFPSDHVQFDIHDRDAIEGVRFTIASISLFVIGNLCWKKRNENDNNGTIVNLSPQEIRQFRKIAWIMLIISAIPTLYIQITRIQYAMVMGYGGLYDLHDSTNPIIKYGWFLANLFFPAILMLLISYYNNHKKALILLISFGVYSLVTMLSGARIDALTNILVLLLFYFRLFVPKVKIHHFVLGVAFIFFLSAFLPALSSLRAGGGMTIESIQQETSAVESSGEKLDALTYEFGGTMISLMYVIKNEAPLNYGLTYIVGLWRIWIKAPIQIDQTFLNDQYCFTNSFTKNYSFPVGGSCLGEAYYNFGFIGCIIFLFVGILVNKMNNKLAYLHKDNIYYFILSLVLIHPLFTWCRGFFSEFCFVAFWVPLIVWYYFKRRSNNYSLCI